MIKNILIIIFLIILLIILIFNFNKEKYIDYNPDKELPYNLQQYQHTKKNIKVFNDNYNSSWLNPQIAYNNPNVNNIAIDELTHGMGDFEQEKSIHTPYINYNLLKDIINEFNLNFTLGYNQFDKILRKKFPNKLNEILDLKNLNNNTWINRYDYNPNKDLVFEYIESSINELNLINKDFLNKFNNIFKKYYNNHHKINFFKYEQFYIYKYKINKYFKYNDIKLFEINIVLLRNHSTHAIHLYLTAFYDKKNYIVNNINQKTNIYYKSLSLIGEDSLDKILILKDNSNNNEFNLINSINNDGFIKNINKVLIKRNEEVKKNISLKSHYKCFDINNPNKIIKVEDKFTCENEFDWYGKPKDIGIWDRPCKSDNECIYYKNNQNYKNYFGKCLKNGKCQLPLNSENIGYHYENKKKKPYCYNCYKNINNTNQKLEWLPVTEINTCCDEQDKNHKKYNKKYDFLDGPDYVFPNDTETRLNYYNNKLFKEGKKYIKYDIKNIFGDFKDTYNTFLE